MNEPLNTIKQFSLVNPDISLAALHDRMVVFAQDTQGALVHIDNVPRGKACHCRCLACGEALIARQGEIKAHSFAHASGTECQYAIDAMLNWLACDLIATRLSFCTPPLTLDAAQHGPSGIIKLSETIVSRNLQVESVSMVQRVHQQRASVVMLIKWRELILEITYAHRLDAHKRASIEKLGLPAIEMHLSDCKFNTIAQFERLLVEDVLHKHWIYNPKAHEIQTRLDGLVELQLAQQIKQHEQQLEQQRQKQAALNAAKVEREQKEQAHLRAVMVERSRLQAQQDQQIRQQQAAREHRAKEFSQKSPENRRQTLCYFLQDGALFVHHEHNDQVLIVAKTGEEQVLSKLTEWGLEYDAEHLGYPASSAELQHILVALRPYIKSVRSV